MVWAAVIAERPIEMFRCDVPTGKMAKTKFLWPELGSIDPNKSKNERLAQTANLITKPENGRFTRTIVNRVWKRMMGRGLVEPVDIMGNRPWNEDLLDFLAIHLSDNGYDLKKTMALIANSKIYQAKTVSMSTPADEEYTLHRTNRSSYDGRAVLGLGSCFDWHGTQGEFEGSRFETEKKRDTRCSTRKKYRSQQVSAQVAWRRTGFGLGRISSDAKPSEKLTFAN